MKDTIAALGATRAAIVSGVALCLFFICGAPAYAQEREWTDPMGRFGLSFSDEGWSVMPMEGAPPTVLLALVHARLQAFSGRDRQCLVTHTPVEGGPRSEAEQDAWLKSLDAAAIGQIIHRPVSDVAHQRVGGRAVIDYTSTSGAFWLRSRVFRVVSGSQLMHVLIACGGQAPISDEERATMDAVLNSLRFLPEAPQ